MTRPTIQRLHEIFLLPDDGRLIRRVDRSSDVSGPVGATDGAGYLQVNVDGAMYRNHCIIFAMTRGKWPDGEVDHANGVKDDNRPDNLRDATRSENMHNRGRQRNSTSGIKGVNWSKQRRKWIAQIMVDRKVHYLGLYDDPREAGEAYKAAAIKFRGEFARA